MRYIWTLVWTFLLTHMTFYVVGSMKSAHYDFKTASVLSIFVAVLVLLITAVIPNEPVAKHSHH